MVRHEITAEHYDRIKHLLPQPHEGRGRPPVDNLNIINGILWRIESGAPWRDIPECFGNWNTIYSRFNLWSKKGYWEEMFYILSQEPDMTACSIDSTSCKVHQHAAGAPRAADEAELTPEEKAAKEDVGMSRGGRNTKIHVVVGPKGRPIALIFTGGNVNDCTIGVQILGMIDINGTIVMGDKAYGTLEIWLIELALEFRGAAKGLTRSCIRDIIYDMTNNTIDFTTILGIEPPFSLTKVTQDADAMRIDIYFDYPRGSKFTCPVCGAEHCSPHGNACKTRRHLDIWDYASFVHLRHPYIKCESCGNTTIYKAPYEGVQGGSFTKDFEAKVVQHAAGTSYVRTSALMRISDRCVSDIVNRYVDNEMSKLDLSGVRRIMIDETGLLGKRGVFTIFTDIDTQIPFCIVRGCGAITVLKMLIECTERGLEPNLVTDVTMDFSSAFYKGASDCFPHAQITQDYFHLVKLLNKAIDAEVIKLTPEEGGTKGVKWTLRRNPSNSPTIEDKQKTLAEQYKTVGRLLALKQSFIDIFEKRSTGDSLELTVALKAWLAWAQRSGFAELKKFAKFVTKHMVGIINILRTGLSNAAAEALNTGAKLIKRIARGCRSARNIISRIQLRVNLLAAPRNSSANSMSQNFELRR